MSAIVEQIGDEFGVTVRYEVEGASVKFFAAEVSGVEEGGKQLYERKGATSGNDVAGFDNATRYVEGFVKWDGCSHYYFGDESGYLHLCGKGDVGKLAETLSVVYERCGELMKAAGCNLLDGEFKVSP